MQGFEPHNFNQDVTREIMTAIQMELADSEVLEKMDLMTLAQTIRNEVDIFMDLIDSIVDEIIEKIE